MSRESYHIRELPDTVRSALQDTPCIDYGKYRYIRRGDWSYRYVERYLISDCESTDPAKLLKEPDVYY